MQKANPLLTQLRAFVQIMKTTPISGALSLGCKMVEGLFPAYTTSILVLLYNAVADYISGKEGTSDVYQLGGLLILGHFVNQTFQLISSITINAALYEKANSYAKGKLYEKSARLPLIAYENASIMDCKRRAEECVNREILSQLFMMNLSMLISAISVISVIAILSSYHLLFLPISIISVVPYFISRVLRGRDFYKLKRQQIKSERRKSYLWTLLTNKQYIKEMRVMGFNAYLSDKWIKVRDEVNEETWTLAKKDAYSLLVCDMIRSAGYGLSLGVACMLVLNDLSTIGMLGACISAFSSVQGQTKTFLIELGNLPEKLNVAEDYFEFLDLDEDYETSEKSINCLQEISFHEVSFRYPNTSHDALCSLSMNIKQGEKVVIVGENGSGKTTLTKLLLGVYQPSIGDIRINGISLQSIHKKGFLEKASVVSQQFVAYLLTLRENVAISHIAAINDDHSIKRSLAAAGLPFPNSSIQLDTQLGTDFGGVELSGGQWQKLSIARGIFRDSEMIVLDEPTSALDPMVESDILQNFLTIAQGKTAIIVSHRTGLCTRADKIAVMRQGRLVEFGTHEELMKKAGEYSKLFNAQRQWYITRQE